MVVGDVKFVIEWRNEDWNTAGRGFRVVFDAQEKLTWVLVLVRMATRIPILNLDGDCCGLALMVLVQLAPNLTERSLLGMFV